MQLKQSFISWSKTTKEKKISLLENYMKFISQDGMKCQKLFPTEMGAPIDWATEEQSSSGSRTH